MTSDDIRTALMAIAAEIERGNHRSAERQIGKLIDALPPATDAEVAALRAELAAAKAEIAARDEIARLRAMSTETLIDLHARRLCESAGLDWSRASGSERDAWAAEVHGALARLRYDDDAAAIVIGGGRSAAYHPHTEAPMSPFACFLVTMFCADDNSLFRVAVRIDTNRHPDADWQHPMEPSTLAAIGSHLPPHASVDSIGPIVEVMEIFEVVP